MNKRRDTMLLRSGLLIGFGAGLCVGLLFLIVAFTILVHHEFIILVHHEFIIGIQWKAPGFLLLFVALPVIFITAGVLSLRKARGIEA